jgi:hypothetical protein
VSAARAVDLSVWQTLHTFGIFRLSVRGIYVGWQWLHALSAAGAF